MDFVPYHSAIVGSWGFSTSSPHSWHCVYQKAEGGGQHVDIERPLLHQTLVIADRSVDRQFAKHSAHVNGPEKPLTAVAYGTKSNI